MELLLTSPVSILQVMMGKYLASLTFLVLMFLGSGITFSSLFIFGHPEWKTVLGGYLGSFYTGARCWRSGSLFPLSQKTRSCRWSSPSAPSWFCG